LFHPDAAPMPAADRLRGYERRLEMEAASPLSALKFRSVGPELQGGRIVAIEAPAAKPDTIFVAFASGGLFRSDNRGGSWTPSSTASRPLDRELRPRRPRRKRDLGRDRRGELQPDVVRGNRRL